MVKNIGWASAAIALAAAPLAAQAPAAPPQAPGSTAPAPSPAQTAASDPSGLNIPANLQIFGSPNPDVRKATAIVNSAVITGTDVDQRVALIGAANNVKIEGEERDRLKLQVLRQLIDETLQIQEAKVAEITITPAELNQSFDRLSGNFKRSPAQMREYLRDQGSSERSLRRQIEGELAWQRYLRKRIEPTTNVSEEEVKILLAKLEADKGQVEYNLREIYLDSAKHGGEQPTFALARQVMGDMGKGDQSFPQLAARYSDATTGPSGGELGWVRTAVLPAEITEAVTQMQVGQVAGPVPVSGGFSILYLADQRRVLTADPRDARLSLKQLTVRFPAGTTQAQASSRVARFAEVTRALQGCGTVNEAARKLDAEVVDNDTVRIRDLPLQLQDLMTKLQVGQSTPPFGNPEEGVRALVLCGRDEVGGGQLPSAEQVQNNLEQQRVNLRAQQKLRDLRRDAVVEYR